jgi:hypothetical protein
MVLVMKVFEQREFEAPYFEEFGGQVVENANESGHESVSENDRANAHVNDHEGGHDRGALVLWVKPVLVQENLEVFG